MTVAVVRFPGSNCDLDTLYVLKRVLNTDVQLVWHQERSLESYEAAILPGGFSYGDYLRAGAIATQSPIMKGIRDMARKGKPVLGICNGFQILVEAGLLPGALLRNSSLRFMCQWTMLRVESTASAITRRLEVGRVLRMPIAHNEGRYFLPENQIEELDRRGQILLRYVNNQGLCNDESNPNGSCSSIAAICDRTGNIIGMMPHPERASEKILSPFHSDDGLLIFRSLLSQIQGGMAL